MRVELYDVALGFAGHAALLERANLSVAEGDFVVVEGESGCGKSSLLRLLNGLQAPTAGRLLVDGSAPAGAELPRLRGRMPLVPQTPLADVGAVRGHLLRPFAWRAHRGRRRPDDSDLRSRLDELRLRDVGLDDETATLSVGQRQRLALLRALLLEPDLLLCDEPTSALDGEARRTVEDLLAARCQAGLGVVLVTHLPVAPQRVTARRLRLADGRLEEAPR